MRVNYLHEGVMMEGHLLRENRRSNITAGKMVT